MRPADMPNWPLFLSRSQAAAYLGVSIRTFDAEVAAGMWPEGVKRGAKGSKDTWHRPSLDVAANQLCGAPATTSDDVDFEQARDLARRAREKMRQDRGLKKRKPRASDLT